jgi:hypothetical protein
VPKKPLKRDELLKRLKRFGVVALKRRGKGSETVLLLPSPENPKKGELFTIRDHGKKTEIYIPVINALLDRFKIDPDDFWK